MERSGGVAAIVCDTTENAVRQGYCYTFFGWVAKYSIFAISSCGFFCLGGASTLFVRYLGGALPNVMTWHSHLALYIWKIELGGCLMTSSETDFGVSRKMVSDGPV